MFLIPPHPSLVSFQNLHNSSGQREFGDSQTDRRKAPSPTSSEEDNVILNSLKNMGPNCECLLPQCILIISVY